MPKHRSGGKFTGSHTTLIDHACAPVDAASRSPLVKKISLGLIQSKKCQPRIKCKKMQAGLEVTICGNAALQTIYIYTDSKDQEAVTRLLTQAFG